MAYVWILFAGLCWGLIGLFTKAITRFGLTEIEILFIKGVVSVIFLAILLLFQDKKSFQLKKKGDILYFVGTGIISFTFFSWCYMKAINLTSVGIAAVMLYTAPTIVMLFSIVLFQETMTKRKALVLIMTICGCGMITGLFQGKLMLTPMGLLMGLGSGIGYALYSIFGTFALRRGYQSLTISFYTFLMASVFMAFCVNPIHVVQEITAAGQWPLTILFAVMTTVVPYLCYTKGLSHLPASKASVTATIEPVVAAVLGILVFKESITVAKIGGILLVVGAVVLMNVGKRPEGVQIRDENQQEEGQEKENDESAK
ncbi:DMT family transporter [Anaerotignum sp.]|uniref:DMT family transporter n=1 Tax=Anaerotignum sp. TaxID=2039241 RepID=UPI00289B2CAB|nr:DMT family transporter [Anaerotignum sp.]